MPGATGMIGGSVMPWPFNERPLLRRVGRTETPPRRRAHTVQPVGLGVSHGSAEHAVKLSLFLVLGPGIAKLIHVKPMTFGLRQLVRKSGWIG